jgi:hypothetical protein
VKLADEQLHRIGATILSRWKAKGLVRPKAADEALVARMAAEIRQDIQREEDLDREAGDLLDANLKKLGSPEANTRILFQKIKERLARERGIVL